VLGKILFKSISKYKYKYLLKKVFKILWKTAWHIPRSCGPFGDLMPSFNEPPEPSATSSSRYSRLF